MATKVDGFLDGAGGKSSKRLQSFLGLLAALLFPVLCGVFDLKIPVAEITASFLVYSAAMQGITYFQERQ